ncbi:hypothetical protein [Limnohabitans sp. B9-3]|uniref:hypothetical protein n=1 Tax=Limnohabitans sp. B9-3 TaxID=1100707 RepID=UPI00117A44A0|nr:hypothetical protein [Limnohabitans sp. B9-3]
MSKLQELQDICQQKGYDKLSSRQVLADWLGKGCTQRFDMGLTLMPKKVHHKQKSARYGMKKTQVLRHLNSSELVNASNRFVELLNNIIYKQAHKRFGKRLEIVMVTEGEQELIDLHVHFAILKPETMPIKQFVRSVHQALELSGDFEIHNPKYDADAEVLVDKYRYKLDLIDEGWITYITKKLDGKDMKNLYLP